MSRVICHKSHVMCHMSCFVCLFFFFFLLLLFGLSGEGYWWSVCYQRGLPRLVYTGLELSGNVKFGHKGSIYAHLFNIKLTSKF